MLETGYLTFFLFGLLGGAHCVGMCGGIVGALSSVQMPGQTLRQWPIHLAYNLGRILTYVALGALLGMLGSMGFLLEKIMPVQIGLYVLANLMLVAMGLYLMGFTRLLAPVERAGQKIWRRIQPLTKRFLPVRSIKQAFPLGLLWGFLPCGLVYSAFLTALVTGSALRGGSVLLAFGLGTLPNMLLAGMAFKRFRDITRHSRVRQIAGMLVLGFGCFGLYHSHDLGGSLWSGVICIM